MQAEETRTRVEEICLTALEARDYRATESALMLLQRGLLDFPGNPALLAELADLARDPYCKKAVGHAVLRTLEQEARGAGDTPIAYELWMASSELRRYL
ncbi:MAG: hypothetical protein JRH20_17290 [Deltaproteobacteria bacterium]|nr:hypothetical protein [Deltaproteobacteria bacterium]